LDRIVDSFMRALVAVGIIIAVSLARADTSLPPPTIVSAIRPSGQIRTISEPKAGDAQID